MVQTIKGKDALQSYEYEDSETWLGTTITNLQTCLDGLKEALPASALVSEISPSLSEGSMLNGVSLAFFKKGWKPASTGKSRFLGELYHLSKAKYGRKNLWATKFYEATNGRKLLQIGDIKVKITKTVVVNPDGRGNYTTINEAILAAPNNTEAGKGYHLIRVVAGVYEEYISIASNKKYLMIVGDGIN